MTSSSARVPESMIFWKWAPEDVELDVALSQVEELCRRSGFSVVCVGLEHSGVSYDSDAAHATICAVAERLGSHGRHLVLSIDPRQEPIAGGRPPGEGLAWVDAVDLDAAAPHAWESVLGPIGDHFGRHLPVGSELLAAWRYQPADNGSAHAIERIDDEVTGDFSVGRATLHLAQHPGTRCLLLVAHWLDYPDVFADSAFARHTRLLERYSAARVAGAAVDEWGPPSQPNRDFDRAWSHPWWSPGLADTYERATGRALLPDLVAQRLAPDGDHDVQRRRRSSTTSG